MTRRQLATVLAALRAWQHYRYAGTEFHEIATDEGAFPPLSGSEIDELCEDLNCGQRTEPQPALAARITRVLDQSDFGDSIKAGTTTIRELLASAGNQLDDNVPGGALFFQVDGDARWWVGSVEFIIIEADQEGVEELLAEAAKEVMEDA